MRAKRKSAKAKDQPAKSSALIGDTRDDAASRLGVVLTPSAVHAGLVELAPTPARDAAFAETFDAHDRVNAAHGELRKLLDGDASHETDTEQMAALLDAIDRALASPVLLDAERRRFENVAAVRGLLPKAGLAVGKAKKNARAAEVLRLVMLVDRVGEMHHGATFPDATARATDAERCAAIIVHALATRGWADAATHAAKHVALVRDALDAWPRRAGRRLEFGASPPSFNQALERLLNADGFTRANVGAVKKMRSAARRPPK